MFRSAGRATVAGAVAAAASASGTVFAEPAVQSEASVPFGANGFLHPLDGSWEDISKPVSPPLPPFPHPADSASASAPRAGRQRGGARVISLAPPSREETEAAWAEVVSTIVPPSRPSRSALATGAPAAGAVRARASASHAGGDESMAESAWESEWGSERVDEWDTMGDDAAASMAASERALQVARASAADAAWQQIGGAALAVTHNVTGRMQQRGGNYQLQQHQHIQQYQQNPIAMLLAQVEADREAVATVRSLASSPGVFMAIVNDPIMQEFIRSRGGVHMPGVNRITEVTGAAVPGQQYQQSANGDANGNNSGADSGMKSSGALWEYLSFALGKMRSVVDAISDLLGTAFLPAPLSTSAADGAHAAGALPHAGAAAGGSSAAGGGSSPSKLASLMTVVVSLVVVVVLVVIKNRGSQHS